MLKLVKIPMVIKKIIFVYNGDDIIGFRYDLKTIEHIGAQITFLNNRNNLQDRFQVTITCCSGFKKRPLYV